MSEQLWWWVARSSGMVAAVLVALTVLWGLALTTKVIPRRGMPAWLTDMHRMLGGLSCAFIAAHLVALYLDSYVHFAWAQLFIPFQSTYRAGAVAWGIGAFWLLVVVEATSLLRTRMPRRVWRGLHYLSYPVAVMVAVHAMTAGTESGNPLFRIVTFALMAVLSGFSAFRFFRRPTRVGAHLASPATGPARSAPVPDQDPPVWAAASPDADMFASPVAPRMGHGQGPASEPSSEVR